MKNILEKIFNFFEIHLACGIYILMLSAVAVQVFSRYVLNTPIPKLFELSIYSFIWTIYLGAALAKRYNQHIRFDIFYRRLPARGQLLIDIFFEIVDRLRIIGKKKISLLFDGNAIARQADNFIKMFEHLDAWYRQSRHGRLCELCPKTFHRCRCCQSR